MKIIINSGFLQLTLIYSVLVLVISLGFISKYSLYFNIPALIIAIFGISIIGKETSINNQENHDKN